MKRLIEVSDVEDGIRVEWGNGHWFEMSNAGSIGGLIQAMQTLEEHASPREPIVKP